jgi:hypothetical protein
VLISTDFEEHRLQAVKMRFEEMATLNNQAALDAVETASRAVSEGTSLSPDGGDRDNASDRRSAVSAGTRLRTVMLDREGTIELFNSLRRAHAVCRRRATSYPAEIRSFIDIDPPVDETAIGAMPDGLMSGGMGGPSAVTGMTPRSVPVAIPGSVAASQERIFSGSMGASPSMLGGASLGGPAVVGASSPNPVKRAGLPPIAPVGTRGLLAAADNNAF